MKYSGNIHSHIRFSYNNRLWNQHAEYNEQNIMDFQHTWLVNATNIHTTCVLILFQNIQLKLFIRTVIH